MECLIHARISAALLLGPADFKVQPVTIISLQALSGIPLIRKPIL